MTATIQLKRMVMALSCVFGCLMTALAAETPVVKGVPLPELIKKWESVPIVEVRKVAEGGDVLAQHYLGYCYVEGERVARDPAEGEKWYLRAMQAGYLSSASNLGFLYQRGLLGTNDLTKAVAMYRFAAERGLDQAQANLGFSYRKGAGVPADPAEALKWFRLAASQGHPVAMVEIGRAYRFGEGVKKDLDEAARWFESAMSQQASNDADRALARLNLGLLYEEKHDHGKAIANYQQAAEAGQTDAMIQLYMRYWDGNGVEKDRTNAMRWLQKAADAKSPYAECLMGYRSETAEWVGEGRDQRLTLPDYKGALRWYRRSAEQGWAGGQYYLGMMYLEGKATARDEARGLELIRAAADQNHKDALHQLAELYACGIGEPRSDNERPVSLLQRAGKWSELQLRYEHGWGTDRDLVMAARCYCKMVLSSKWNQSRHDLAEMIEFRPELGNPVGFSLERPLDDHLTMAGPPHRLRKNASDDVLRMLTFYLKSVRGDGIAAFFIGELYEKGKSTPKSPSAAWAWFSIAAKRRGAGKTSYTGGANEPRRDAEGTAMVDEYRSRSEGSCPALAMNLQRICSDEMSYDLRMKMLSSWLLILLLTGEVRAQLQVVPEQFPQAVFGGMSQNIAVQFRNAGPESLESDMRVVLLQTSTATAARDSEWFWKNLRILRGQTVLEEATVSFPAVHAETRFLIQWIADATNVVGHTEVRVCPTNLLTRLRTLAGNEALGVYDPTDTLKPLLQTQAVEFVNLADTGTDKFRGKLAVFGPFETKIQMRVSLREDVRALAKRGAAVVWLLPPQHNHAPLKPSFYAVQTGGSAVVVAAHDLVAHLALRPEAQLTLLRLAEEALRPTPLDLPRVETNDETHL